MTTFGKLMLICIGGATFYISMGCIGLESDEPPDLDWDLINQEQIDPIVPGLYKVSFAMRSEGCMPSVESLLSSVDRWPPSHEIVRVSLSRDGYGNSATVRVPGLRRLSAGDIVHTNLDYDFRPHSTRFLEERWPSDQEMGYSSCPQGPWYARFQQDAHIVTTGEGSFRVDLDVEWFGDYDECEDENMTFASEWIPRDFCRESLSYHYDLLEACLPLEFCEPWISYAGPAGGPSMPDVSSYECICD